MSSEEQTQALWDKAHQKQGENLDLTRNIRNVLIGTDDVANDNLEMLNEQGETLDEVERKLAQQNNAMRNAEKQIVEMEKCCFCIICPWNRSKNIEHTDEYKKAYGSKANKPIDLKKKQPKKSKKPVDIPPDPRNIQASRAIDNEAADEIDDNLNDISDYIRNLKAKAGEMGDEMDRQNAQLDRVNNKVTANTTRVEHGTKRVNNIIVNG